MTAIEPLGVRAIRTIFRRFPFPRGRGVLFNVVRPLLEGRRFVFDVADGVLVPSDLNDWITLHGFIEGYSREFDKSWSLIRDGMTVFDIGANIGIWAIGAAKRVGSIGRVHAFEPLESNFSRLLSNIEINQSSNVIPQQIALSDRAGSCKFYPSPNKNSGVGRVVMEDWAGPHCTVQAITLDEYCARYDVSSVHFLKLDVEGAELLVLKGSTQLLGGSMPPVIIFEMGRFMAADLKCSPEEVESFLASFGYSIYAKRNGKWIPVDLSGFIGPEDLLAIPSTTPIPPT